jgi:hypothetical protein
VGKQPARSSLLQNRTCQKRKLGLSKPTTTELHLSLEVTVQNVKTLSIGENKGAPRIWLEGRFPEAFAGAMARED